MPVIRKTTDLLNNFNEILEFCQNYREPMFLTDDGQGKLAVMSMESYEELIGRIELYYSLQVGLDQINNGEIIEEEEMFKKLNNYIGK